jgi:putative tryptophan/tyrosine transport system substrate-binding protein
MQLGYLGRRDFMIILGASAAGSPLRVHAQQNDRMRRVGILIGYASGDVSEAQDIIAAFVQGLQQLGWTEGANLQVASLSAVGSPDNVREYANELDGLARALAALEPEVILTDGTVATAAIMHTTRTTPIVFMNVSDPVASGFVDSLRRPGGRATGFANFGYSIAGKWLELLKEIAPDVSRAAVILDRATAVGIGQWDAIQAVAPALRVEAIPAEFDEEAELERAVATFARVPDGGLVVTTSALVTVHRERIIALAARYKLPAVYPRSLFVVEGGLISYGPVQLDQFRRAAIYVDHILKGEKIADLPVLTPTKSELTINLKTAKALGIEVPANLIKLADKLDP